MKPSTLPRPHLLAACLILALGGCTSETEKPGDPAALDPEAAESPASAQAALQAQGNACAGGAQCPSGLCIDGVCVVDPDGDGVLGGDDNCPNAVNPSQLDSDGDGQGDACDPTCVNLRRGLLGGVSDTRIGLSSPNTSYGSTTTLVTGGSAAEMKQALLRFDLSLLPSHATITSAGLTIKTLSASGAGAVRMHRALSPWEEGTVTWNSFGGAHDPAVITSFPGTAGPHSVDIKALAQAWVYHPEENFGLVFEQDAGATTFFKSSEYGVAADRPSQFVCYVLPECPPGKGDCDDDPENGCEASIDQEANCGACGNSCEDGNDCTVDVCEGPMSTCTHSPRVDGEACSNGAVCLGGACQSWTCSDGIQNQGEAGVDCGGPCRSCATCSPGYGDCDHESFYSFDGCESRLDTALNCGACGVACDDRDPCTSDACGPGPACVHTPVADGTACSNGDGCSEGSTCVAGTCSAGSPIGCGPGAGLVCDPARSWTRPSPLDSLKISIDAGGNVILSGLQWGMRDFGGGPRGGESLNVFLVKLDKAGQHVFSHGFPIDGGTMDASSAIDPQGNIVLAGYTDWSFYLGGVAMSGLFAAKFDPAGNLLWARGPAADAPSPFGGSWDTLRIASLSVDQGGDVLMALDLYSYYTLFAYVGAVKLDASGNVLWAKPLWERKVELDLPSVNVGSVVPKGAGLLVSGSFRRTFDLAGAILWNGYNYDGFVAEFDSVGDLISVRAYGNPNGDQFGGLLADGDPGPVILSGSVLDGSVDLGDGPIVASPTCGNYLAGLGLWSKCFPATESDHAGFTALERVGGSLVAAGYFRGTIDFGGGPVASEGDDRNLFVARYDIASGSLLWWRRLGPADWYATQMMATGDDIVVGGRWVWQSFSTIGGVVEKLRTTGDLCGAAPDP